MASIKTGMFPCMSCNCCSSIMKGNIVNHPTRGYEIKIKTYATCNTTHVVYLLKCPCGMGYMKLCWTREVEIGLKKLLQLEGRWIKKLNTLSPDGMNDSCSLKPYL
ncbi:hypothetical protein XELAEV_18022640mg [Xenopus laevis]|uniref:Uncharacterized protein n=1 Tax=Xenopus laevis TaxID=8355 RepID=A0A974D3L5_XENLA|nr:hypothetical protein XELAEV_18022640mg [Xenopus laevis]